MDQQVVDCRGLKLQRVNDIAMALSDGTLCLWGMDTGVRGLLTRLGFHWGLFALLRPLSERLHHHVIGGSASTDSSRPAAGFVCGSPGTRSARMAARLPITPVA